jgi:hypothetical protein
LVQKAMKIGKNMEDIDKELVSISTTEWLRNLTNI